MTLLESVKIYKLFLPSQKSMFLTVLTTLFLILTAGFVGSYIEDSRIAPPGEVINIAGNFDFLQQANQNTWTGEGTESNPIVIENLNIYSITISNTNLYFVFRFNKVTGISVFDNEWKGGLILHDVMNGVLLDNEISHYKKNIHHLSESTSGLLIIESKSLIIRNNHISYYPLGIQISNSENMIFSDISISNGIIGMMIHHADNVLFKDGLIEKNELYGLKIDSGYRNIFGGNTFKDNGQFAVILSWKTDKNAITRNNMLGSNTEDKSQASDSGRGNEFLANYWSDFSNDDINNDGFVDVGYWISGLSDNKDFYPSADRIRLSFDFYNNLGALP